MIIDPELSVFCGEGKMCVIVLMALVVHLDPDPVHIPQVDVCRDCGDPWSKSVDGGTRHRSVRPQQKLEQYLKFEFPFDGFLVALHASGALIAVVPRHPRHSTGACARRRVTTTTKGGQGALDKLAVVLTEGVRHVVSKGFLSPTFYNCGPPHPTFEGGWLEVRGVRSVTRHHVLLHGLEAFAKRGRKAVHLRGSPARAPP